MGISLPNIDAGRFVFGSSARLFPIDLVAMDVERDVAVFHTSENVFAGLEPYITGNASPAFSPQVPPATVTFLKLRLNRPKDGQAVFACGFPFGASGLVTTSGLIASAWKSEKLVTANEASSEVYWADLRINPGNSGGPVFETRNHSVIGMAVELKGGSLGIVVPSKYIADFLDANKISWTNASGLDATPQK